MTPIYLDYNATTPTSPEVADALRPFLESGFGNPSSTHWAGAPSKAALDEARRQVGTFLDCETDEIVLTSGGSEANNLAIKGRYFMSPGGPTHVITSRIENPAILAPCGFLERLGAAVTYLPVDGTGLVDPDEVRKAIRSETIQPIADSARIAHAHGVPVHTDAAQSAGKISARVDESGVDLLSVAGHKLYAPKGVRALYVGRGTALEPLIHGAGHERGRRAGTESALLAMGLGAACRTAIAWAGMPSVERLRDLLWERLQTSFGDRVILNGHPATGCRTRSTSRSRITLGPISWRECHGSRLRPAPRATQAGSRPRQCFPPWVSPRTSRWARSGSASDARRRPRRSSR